MAGRKRYTKEFKLDAVSLVLDQGHTRSEVARMLDVSQQIIGANDGDMAAESNSRKRS